MVQLKHFFWFCSLSTGGILISFATFMQSLWQGLTIWPYYEQTQSRIDDLRLDSLRQLFDDSRPMLVTFCVIWSFFILASIVSSAILVHATMNVSLKLLIWIII